MKRFFNWLRRLWALPGQCDLAWERIVALEKSKSELDTTLGEFLKSMTNDFDNLQKQVETLRVRHGWLVESVTALEKIRTALEEAQKRPEPQRMSVAAFRAAVDRGVVEFRPPVGHGG